MTIDPISAVVASIEAAEAARLGPDAAPTTPLLVAVDGMSAAGKSTLAARVVDALADAALVHGDDFYRVMDNDDRFALTPEDGYNQDFDWQRLRHQVLEPLRAGRTASYQRYDWSTGQLGEWAEVGAVSTVVIEGVYVSRAELRSQFDLVVWVETSAATRARRQAKRDDTPSWVDRWDAAERHYIDRYAPAALADLVVPGEPGSAQGR